MSASHSPAGFLDFEATGAVVYCATLKLRLLFSCNANSDGGTTTGMRFPLLLCKY